MGRSDFSKLDYKNVQIVGSWFIKSKLKVFTIELIWSKYVLNILVDFRIFIIQVKT